MLSYAALLKDNIVLAFTEKDKHLECCGGIIWKSFSRF